MNHLLNLMKEIGDLKYEVYGDLLLNEDSCIMYGGYMSSEIENDLMRVETEQYIHR